LTWLHASGSISQWSKDRLIALQRAEKIVGAAPESLHDHTGAKQGNSLSTCFSGHGALHKLFST